MAANVILPKWGLTMEDGTIVAWYVDEGDHVVEGEVIAEVETEKVENERTGGALRRRGGPDPRR